MPTEWTVEMQAQFEVLRQDIQAQFDKQTAELTKVISIEIQKRLDQTEERLFGQFRSSEERLSRQYQVAVEAVRGEVKLASEAFGGVLEVIQRDIRGLGEKFDTTIGIHARVVAEHSRDIAELKRIVEGD